MKLPQISCPVGNISPCKSKFSPFPQTTRQFAPAQNIYFAGVPSEAIRATAMIDKTPASDTAKKIWELIQKSDAITVHIKEEINGDILNAGLIIFKSISEHFPDKKAINFIVEPEIPKFLLKTPGIYHLRRNLPPSNDLIISIHPDRIIANQIEPMTDCTEKLSEGFVLKNQKYESVSQLVKKELFQAMGIKLSFDCKKYANAGITIAKASNAENNETRNAAQQFEKIKQTYPEWLKNKQISKDLKFLINSLTSKVSVTETSGRKKINYVFLKSKDLEEINDSDYLVSRELRKLLRSMNKCSTDISIVFYEPRNRSGVTVLMKSENVDLKDFIDHYKGKQTSEQAGEFSIEKNLDAVINDVLKTANEDYYFVDKCNMDDFNLFA